MSENTNANSCQIGFSQEQIDYLSSLLFINKIDDHLRIISSVKVISTTMHTAPLVKLMLEIFYDNHQSGNISFDLRNYEYDDIVSIAQNIRDNDFILQEVDNYLSGDAGE